MLDPHWVFAAALLGVVGSIRYAIAIVRGAVRPNLVTWSLWAAAPLIAFFAQLDSGVGLPAVMTLAAGAGPLIVIITSMITRRHYAHLNIIDLVCAGVAVAALTVWLGLGAAPLAVLFAVAADAIAAIPTLVKAWRHPDSENIFFFVLVGVAATITLLTLTAWTPQSFAFAVYQLSICLILTTLIATRRHAHQRSPSRRA
ncbi:MAG: hypothetical protein GXY65_02630 [Rhodococcus sp.]|uniref:hypothetical protein n=1 Tax=Rhodococcus TaxID=1827 RepID=UPI0016BBBC4A|nr:hypothetical protein [Rhodococcus sp. (in: high G+C Gram-positive bacteria)]NLV78238.1 hypothetical protein [Rhodococcus sp. (in: high G+C Gram-positive bacteria)]